mmetsp:Transcript_60903/g.175476  ORF Transcript_60903/g.175476 Transcript_60903/m.175476 type:complete len:232 (+) Transcript_60903:195-890(+)
MGTAPMLATRSSGRRRPRRRLASRSPTPSRIRPRRAAGSSGSTGHGRMHRQSGVTVSRLPRHRPRPLGHRSAWAWPSGGAAWRGGCSHTPCSRSSNSSGQAWAAPRCPAVGTCCPWTLRPSAPCPAPERSSRAPWRTRRSATARTPPAPRAWRRCPRTPVSPCGEVSTSSRWANRRRWREVRVHRRLFPGQAPVSQVSRRPLGQHIRHMFRTAVNSAAARAPQQSASGCLP